MSLAVRGFGMTSVLVDAADPDDARGLADRIRRFADATNSVGSVVPAAASVLVHTRPGASAESLCADVTAALDAVLSAPRPDHRVVTVPVRYDGEDLHTVADLLRLSVDEVVARHTAPDYTVDFLGFAPGFPYLSGLDPLLTIPRLDTPRTRVPAGAVGLAGGSTCIYPSPSPGGWRLIGATDTILFDAERDEPALLRAGDTVRFQAVSR